MPRATLQTPALPAQPPNAPTDENFIIQLYENYKHTMFATAGKYISDRAACEDVVQDCLVKLIEKISVLRGKDSRILCSYIVFTVKNTAINYLKRQSRINARTCSLDEQDLFSPAPSLDEWVAAKERGARIAEIWNLLNDNEQLLLTGKYILENTDAELAAQLCCKPGSVRMKLTRLRRKVYRMLTEKGDDFL